MSRPTIAVLLMTGLVFLAACSSASHPSTPTPTSTAAAAPTRVAVTPRARVSVTVQSQAISPQRLVLPQDELVEIDITNQGDPCLFYVGEYLQGLLVMQNQTEEATLIAPAQSGFSGLPADVTMGCLGEKQRQGAFAVEAAGASATPGATPAAATPPAGERQIVETVRANGLQPAQADLAYDTPVRVTISNQSGPCLFYFGDYLRGLLMPANSVADATFVAPGKLPYPRSPVNTVQGSPTPSSLVGQFASSGGPPNVVSMGCVGDPQRQGKINVPPQPAGTPSLATPPPPPPPPSLTPAPGGAQRIPQVSPTDRSLTVNDGNLDPGQITVEGDIPAQLHITNKGSSTCTFSAGEYVQNQQIPPGQTVTVSFTVPAGRETVMPMGCAGHAEQQGRILVQYGGVLPSGR